MSTSHEAAAQEWGAEKQAFMRQTHLPTKSTQRRTHAAVSKTGVDSRLTDLSRPCTRCTGIDDGPVAPLMSFPWCFMALLKWLFPPQWAALQAHHPPAHPQGSGHAA